MTLLFEIICVCSLCVGVKKRRCDDVRVLVVSDRQGICTRDVAKYKHRDMLISFETQTHAEKIA